MRRRLASCLALGLTLLLARAAEARPTLELTTTIGGADTTEYLVRVANPDLTPSQGKIELRRPGEEHAVARTTFEVPPKGTRYIRMPGEKGQRLEAVALADGRRIVGQDHLRSEGVHVIFDIPPRDEQRLHELRVHTGSGPSTTITHASFDEETHTPVLTRRAAVYEGVDLVLVPTGVFLALPAEEREAITAWVRTGGALAFSVSEVAHLALLSELIGPNVSGVQNDEDQTTAWIGSRLHPVTFGATAQVGLGNVHLLPLDPWSAKANGDSSVQEKLVELASRHRVSNRFSSGSWPHAQPSSLDPNQGYRSVLALAGILLVVQALGTAFFFRRLALRRGMGPAYRFVVGSSAATFAAMIGLGVYAKGGFGARASELTFADAASGESVAWVERHRTYFASTGRTVEVTPRDTSNLVSTRDSNATLRTENGRVVLGELTVRPWQATPVTERGTTTLGSGVTISNEQGKVVVRNATGKTLRHVVVAASDRRCHFLGDIGDGEEKRSDAPQSCMNLGPAWTSYAKDDTYYGSSIETYLFNSNRLTLMGQLDEGGPATIDGFRMEKRTTLLRVRGGDS